MKEIRPYTFSSLNSEAAPVRRHLGWTVSFRSRMPHKLYAPFAPVVPFRLKQVQRSENFLSDILKGIDIKNITCYDFM